MAPTRKPGARALSVTAGATVCAVLFGVDAGPGAAQESESPWSIEESRAPTTTPLRFTATEGTWMSVDVSPDGARIAFDLLGHIYEMPYGGGEARALTTGRSWNMFPRYSPDGGRIALTSDRAGTDDVWVLDLADDSFENVSKAPGPVVRPTWSLDGNALYGSSLDQMARSTARRYNLYGNAQDLTRGTTFQPTNQMAERAGSSLVYFEQLDQQLYASGARIKTYDRETGEVEVYRQRPGGAFNPTVSPDGSRMVYGHRDDRETVLVLHEFESRTERIIARGLDRDHQEYSAYYYGVSTNLSWHPDGQEIVVAFGGKIRAIDVMSGDERVIEFSAPVDRELDETIRFPFAVPEGTTRTMAHRWAHRTREGVVFEALGDVWMVTDGSPRPLTTTPGHETSPVVDSDRAFLYYARWTDEDLGAVYRQSLTGGSATRLTNRPSQYGSLALAPDGSLAFLRGQGHLQNGQAIEQQTEFELVTVSVDGTERTITDVSGTPNTQSRLPLTVHFGPEGEWIYYSEFLADTLTLRRIRTDGTEKRTLYRFPHGERVVLSPDLEWMAFREYHRSYVTPFEWIGRTETISGLDGQGFTKRVDGADGAYLAWSGAGPDGLTVSWPRGGKLYEKSLDGILDGEGAPETTDIAVSYEVATPTSTIALTDATVITMDADRTVLEGATILVEGNRISAVGTDVEVPTDARVFDFSGHTIMPGMVDAHAHPAPGLSQTNMVEQRIPGLTSALAHGVTTLYELYGTEEKDPWVRDMVQSGRMVGPRLLTVGAPMYGLREFRPKTYRPVDSYEDALEHATYSRDQGVPALKDYVNFSRADRQQIAAAAREAGLNVVAETAGNAPMNFTQIVDGLTGLEHSMGLTPLYQDVIELFKASDVGVTPTLLVVYNGPAGQAYFDQSNRVWEDPKLLNFVPAASLRSFRRVTHYWDDDLYAPEMAANMKTLFDEGVLVNAGGHGQMLGLDMHWELELFVQGGFTPMDALQTATRNSAEYYGLDESVGSIEVGKLADLVVLGSDPLDDIRNTQDIHYVVMNGVVYDGEDAARVFPDPSPAPRMYTHAPPTG